MEGKVSPTPAVAATESFDEDVLGSGIFRRRCSGKGACKYRASLSLFGLRLQAPPRSDLRRAKADLAELVRVVRQVRNHTGSSEARVRHALRLLGDNQALHDKLPGLILQVATCALYRQVLLSPAYSLDQLDEVLAAWLRLQRARTACLGTKQVRRRSPAQMQDSWQHIRSAYIELWQSAGAAVERVQRSLDRLESLVEKRFQQQWESWNRRRMASEEKQTRAALWCERREQRRMLREDKASRRVSCGQVQAARREARTLERLERLISRWPCGFGKTHCNEEQPKLPDSSDRNQDIQALE